ncbi:MAG: hypothetical protein AABX53_04410, partial [Nanoarchaeota archaeon]
SFVNAGYHEAEVREVAQTLQGGTAALIAQQVRQSSPVAALPQRQIQPLRQQQDATIRTSFEVRRQRTRPSLLIIVLSLILLLSVTGFILSLLFRKEIADALAAFLA